MYKFTFLADLHYYSKTLGTSGRAYELRSGSDQKCLAESGAIIDAAFNHLARSDTQAVLLAELDLRLKPVAGLIAALGEAKPHTDTEQ